MYEVRSYWVSSVKHPHVWVLAYLRKGLKVGEIFRITDKLGDWRIETAK